jgi:hypothetical protein
MITSAHFFTKVQGVPSRSSALSQRPALTSRLALRYRTIARPPSVRCLEPFLPLQIIVPPLSLQMGTQWGVRSGLKCFQGQGPEVYPPVDASKGNTSKIILFLSQTGREGRFVPQVLQSDFRMTEQGDPFRSVDDDDVDGHRERSASDPLRR